MAPLSLALADEEDEDEEEDVRRCGAAAAVAVAAGAVADTAVAAAVVLGTLESSERSILTRRFFRPRLDTEELFSVRPNGTRV